MITIYKPNETKAMVWDGCDAFMLIVPAVWNVEKIVVALGNF